MNPGPPAWRRFPGISERTLMRYLCGELAPDELREVEQAAACCAELAEYLSLRKREREQFYEQHPFSLVRARIARSPAPPSARWRGWWAMLVPTAVVAAAAALIALRPSLFRPSEVVARGGFKATLFVKRSERVFEYSESTPVRPKDRLRVRIEDPHGGYVWVFGLSARGEVASYYGDSSGYRLGPGIALLPDSLEVDNSPTPEALYVVLSNPGRPSGW